MSEWGGRHARSGWLAVWCLGITLFLYGRAMELPFFFDDFVHLPYVDTFSLPAMWTSAGDLAYYRPLSFSIWKIMQLVLGDNDPFLQHSFNLVLHTANGWLVGWLAGRLWSNPKADPAARVSAVARPFLAATLFLSFPFSYQAVPWIGALSHLLVTGLILGAIAAYWQGRQTGRLGWYALSLAATALAPFAHENGALVGPLLALVALTRPDANRRAFAWLRWPLLWTIPALIWLPIWWLAPKAIAGEVSLNGLEAIGQNLTYFLQGLAYPTTWLGARLRDGWGWNDLLVVWLLALPGLAAAGVAAWRRRQAPAALPWLWAAVVIWPAVLFLRFDYVINGPRLLMLVGVAAAWLWSDVLLTWLGPALPPARATIWRWLPAGVLLGLVLGQNVAFIRARMALHAQLGLAYDQAVAVTDAANAAAAPAILVNLPSWLSPPRATYALGHEGVQFWPDYARPNNLVAVQTGRPAELRLVRVDAIRQDQPYYYGVAGGAPDWPAGPAGHVYVAQYLAGNVRLELVGRLNAPPPAATLAQFALPEAPDQPVLALAVTRSTTNLALTWHALAPLPPDVTVFVHILDQGGALAAQLDGDPLAGIYPLADLAPGDALVDLRDRRPDGVDDAPILIGLYRRSDGQRLIAVDPAGMPFADNAVRLNPEAR